VALAYLAGGVPLCFFGDRLIPRSGALRLPVAALVGAALGFFPALSISFPAAMGAAVMGAVLGLLLPRPGLRFAAALAGGWGIVVGVLHFVLPEATTGLRVAGWISLSVAGGILQGVWTQPPPPAPEPLEAPPDVEFPGKPLHPPADDGGDGGGEGA
jgi:hypothetical protein